MGSSSENKVVIITGCGSGVGLALTKQLIESGNFRVVATARPLALKKLLELGYRETDQCMLRPLDIISGVSRRTLLKEVLNMWGRIDVLVNNAGISFRSSIEDMDTAEEELQMATNYFGPMALIREILPFMRAQRSGQIINVSSVGGMMAMPTMGSYSASKFALEGASEALWYELKPWGISLSLVQPGFINSNSFHRVYRSTKSKTISDYAPYYENMEKFISRLMSNAAATAESVANKITKLINDGSGALRVPATMDAHVFSTLRRLLPRSLYHKLLFNCLPNIEEWAKEEEAVYTAPTASLLGIIKKAANL